MSDGEEVISSSTLYKDNPEWKDIEPIYSTAAEEAAVRIASNEHFRDVFAYFRAIVQKGERSERVLKLTADCIEKNPANYTVWQYRRDCLTELNKNLWDELGFLDEIILENPKNYQVWHHRRAIVERIGKAGYELDFTEQLLNDDAKNYHAWQHREWVVRRFDLPMQPELDFSMKLLAEDTRNNSAWNYRYFILQLADRLADKNTLDIEINLALRLIESIPHNESSWNYLCGILSDSGLSTRPNVLQFVQTLYDQSDVKTRSPFIVSFLVDVRKERIERHENTVENAEEAKKLLDELITLDPIRSAFWGYQKIMVESDLQKALLLGPNA